MSGRLSPGLECPATAHSQWVEEGLERQTEGSSAGFIACYLTQCWLLAVSSPVFRLVPARKLPGYAECLLVREATVLALLSFQLGPFLVLA